MADGNTALITYDGAAIDLSDKKEVALQLWLLSPLATFKEVAAAAGISEQTFREYRKDPVFMERYHQGCLEKFGALEGLAMRKLEQQVQKGNMTAIKYVLDGLGYKPTTKVEAQVKALSLNIDIDEG